MSTRSTENEVKDSRANKRDETEIQQTAEQQTLPKTGDKLWNTNFFLLWQGRLISGIGDRLYEIALGFHVLQVSDSPALMGAIMATSTIPRLVLAPFAGTIADRWNRKWILVNNDLIRGAVVLLVGLLLFAGIYNTALLFLSAIVLGICGSFFGPAAASVVPDIVPKDKLVKANAANSLIHSGSGILGNLGGAFLFAVLGAPMLFMLDGLSFILSGFSEMFLKIPEKAQSGKLKNFKEDLKEGFSFVLKNRQLFKLVLTLGYLNFFLNIGNIVLMPMFEADPALGVPGFGIASAAMMASAFAAFLFLTFVKIPSAFKGRIYIFVAIIFSLSRAFFPFMNVLLPIAISMGVFGFTISIINSFNTAFVQLIVPREYRGKVYSFLHLFTAGLSPLGTAVGGILAETIDPAVIIAGTSIALFLGFLPLILDRSVMVKLEV